MFFIPYGTLEDTPRRSFPLVTVLLVTVNVAVFVFEAYLLVTLGENGLNDFVNRFAAVPSSITGGNPLQIGLLTSMFLHAGALQISSILPMM